MEKQVETNTKTSFGPTTFTDGVNIGCRSDGGILLQFVSETPDFYVENHRTVMTKEGITEFIESLCAAIDYYPEKITEEDIQEIKEK